MYALFVFLGVDDVCFTRMSHMYVNGLSHKHNI